VAGPSASIPLGYAKGEASIIINALEPTPTASARASLRLLARLTAGVSRLVSP
jgi:hypothetical protein